MAIDKKILRPIKFPDLVRIGRQNDGGYVVPRSILDSINVLVSFGVGDDWSFEECIRRHKSKIKIEAYDHTISASLLRTRSLSHQRLGPTESSESSRLPIKLRIITTQFV